MTSRSRPRRIHRRSYTAVAKTGNEAKVLTEYRTASGRRKVINLITGTLQAGLADRFSSSLGILSYWRDDAGHGIASTIGEIEAHEALARLLRLAQLVTDNWTELTS